MINYGLERRGDEWGYEEDDGSWIVDKEETLARLKKELEVFRKEMKKYARLARLAEEKKVVCESCGSSEAFEYEDLVNSDYFPDSKYLHKGYACPECETKWETQAQEAINNISLECAEKTAIKMLFKRVEALEVRNG